MASGNDHHIDPDTNEIHPTLGRDEPTADQLAGARSKGAAKLNALREELAAAGAELSEREKKALAREESLIAKERELELRERTLVKKEKAKTAAAAAE